MELGKDIEMPSNSASSELFEAEARIASLESQVAALRAQLAQLEPQAATDDGTTPAIADPRLISQVIDSVDTLVVILDHEGRVVLFNRACEKLYGYTAQAVQGKYIWELFRRIGHEDSAKRAFEDLQTTGTSSDLERYAVERNGQRYYIQWSSRRLDRSDGPPYIVITGVNVTRRREAERALKLQVSFEQLIARLSRQFISLTSENLDSDLAEALDAVAETSGADACSIWLHEEDSEFAVRRWHRPQAEMDRGAERQRVPTAEIKGMLQKLRVGEALVIDRVEDMPAGEAADLKKIAGIECGAWLLTPLVVADRLLGWLSLEIYESRPWLAESISLAKIVAELIANAIERVHTDEALRASEGRLRTIFAGMPVMLWATAARPDFTKDPPEVTFLAWNAECERVSGYRADEVIGNPRVYELLAPDEDYYRRLTQELEVLGNDFRDSHWLMRTRSGEMRMIAWSNLSGRMPIPGWAEWGIGIDVTEQYKAQQELIRARHDLEIRVDERTRELTTANDRLTREIENREVVQGALLHQTRILRAILNSIFDGVAVADRDGKFILFNKAAERILQTGAVEASPDDWPRIYGLYLPDRVTPYDPNELPLVRATRGEVVESAEIYLNRSDGPQGVWLSVNASPLEDHEGELQGGVALFRDITEMKRAHEELQAEQKLLQQLLRAHERDRQLLAYEIHDGLVQDVTGALLHLESYEGRRKRNADQAEAEFQLCMRLMRQTIDEARRVISGLRPPILDEQGIVAAIEYLLSEHRMRAPIEVDFHHAISVKHYDSLLEGTIYRIVQEALSNVFRHSRATRVEVALAEHNDLVQLQILDNGVGFDPRQVVENRYGLEGIRERARLLRGSARIESAPGQGTRVYVELPAMQRNVREGNQNEYSDLDCG